MTKKDIPFGQKPYSAPLTSLGSEVLNNFYVELASNETSKSRYYYIGIPGLQVLKKTASDQFNSSSACRGLYTTSGNKTYGVFGKTVVEIQFAQTSLGPQASYLVIGELNTGSGIVRFADNKETMLIVDGSWGYTVNIADNTFAQITEDTFPGVENGDNGPTHCACVDTYFIVNSKDTNKYYWSAPGYVPYAFDSTNPSVETLWNALDYGEKLGDSDNIVGLIQTVNQLWVIGQNSIEIHVNQGNGDDASGQVFGRMQNAFVNFGCGAPNSICKFGNTVYWLGHDKSGAIGVFSSDSSFQLTRISTRGVETRIQDYSTISDCYSYVFSHNGHNFIVFQFPSGTPTDDQYQVTGATWVYDITNGTWTRRTHWSIETGLSSIWRGNFCTYNFGRVILGDISTNAIYWLNSDKYENDNPDGVGTNMIERIVTSPIGYTDAKNVVYRSVQLQMQPGTGLTNDNSAGIGADPKVEYSYSNDSGFSWIGGRESSFGTIGQYAYRCRWVKCGVGRNRVHKFRITDPVFVAVIALTVDLEVLSA